MSLPSALHPELLLGLAAALLPAALHLVGRRRAQRIAFAAFDFLQATQARLARRESVRGLLLLLLRTAALVALALAVSRPMPPGVRPAAADVLRRVAIVIDTSASMGYVQRGHTLLWQAQRQALDVVAHLNPGDLVTVVAAGPQPQLLLPAPSLERSAARAAIDGLTGCAGVADIAAALAQASAQFSAAGPKLTVVVIGDLARNSFAQLQPLRTAAPTLRLIDAAQRQVLAPLPNVALEDMAVEAAAAAAGDRQFHLRLRNYGATAAPTRALELAIDGQVVQRSQVALPAAALSDHVFTHRFAAPGAYVVQARLLAGGAGASADGYGADDALERVVEVARGIRVLAVDGQPRTTPFEDELFFVERALAAVPRGDPPLLLSICTPGQLAEPGRDLAAYDVVLLANVAAPSADVVARLQGFVQAGGGLFVALGGAVAFEAANAALGNLLPHPLRDVHLAADLAAGTAALGMLAPDWEHPLLQGLGAAAEASLRASHTARYFNLDVGAERAVRTVLRFSDGAPALVEARHGGPAAGQGRVLLWTTSIDLDDTDLPLRSAFVPLLQRSMRYLAQAVEAPVPAPTLVGGTAHLAVPTGAVALALVSPAGVRLEPAAAAAPRGSDDAADGAAQAAFGPLAEVGIYRAEVRRAAWGREPRLDVAVQGSRAESDFAPVQPEAVTAALSAGGAAVDVALSQGRQDNPLAARGYGSYLLWGLALAFVAESLLAACG